MEPIAVWSSEGDSAFDLGAAKLDGHTTALERRFNPYDNNGGY